MKVHVRLVVVKILGWVFNPGIALDTRGFEFVGELNLYDLLGEWGRLAHKIIHPRSFPHTSLLNLLLKPVVLLLVLLIERSYYFAEPSLFERRIHYTP